MLQNLKAKQGMRLLESDGRLHKFARRSYGKAEEMRDWEIYFKKRERNAELLKYQRPDIVQK